MPQPAHQGRSVGIERGIYGIFDLCSIFDLSSIFDVILVVYVIFVVYLM